MNYQWPFDDRNQVHGGKKQLWLDELPILCIRLIFDYLNDDSDPTEELIDNDPEFIVKSLDDKGNIRSPEKPAVRQREQAIVDKIHFLQVAPRYWSYFSQDHQFLQFLKLGTGERVLRDVHFESPLAKKDFVRLCDDLHASYQRNQRTRDEWEETSKNNDSDGLFRRYGVLNYDYDNHEPQENGFYSRGCEQHLRILAEEDPNQLEEPARMLIPVSSRRTQPSSTELRTLIDEQLDSKTEQLAEAEFIPDDDWEKTKPNFMTLGYGTLYRSTFVKGPQHQKIRKNDRDLSKWLEGETTRNENSYSTIKKRYEAAIEERYTDPNLGQKINMVPFVTS